MKRGRASRALAATLLAGVLAGCQPPVKVVRVDSAKPNRPQQALENRCGFRIARVLDERPEGEGSGGMGLKQMQVDDAPGLVQRELIAAGLRPPEAEGRDVEVRIRHLYLGWNQYTKVPVAVYSVSAQGLADFNVRGQPTGMTWSGSTNEAVSALYRAVHEANLRVLATLNASCAG